MLSTTTVMRRIGTLTHVRLACASVSRAAMHRHTWQGCGNDVSLLLVPVVSGSMESPMRSAKERVVPFNDTHCAFFCGSFNMGLLALSASISAVEIDRCLEPSQVVCLSRESQRLICMINLPMTMSLDKLIKGGRWHGDRITWM